MKLYYFDFYARAEPIRMILTHAKVPFENIIVTQEEFKKQREEGKLEFGKLPAIEHDGKVYTETMSILRYIGKNHGYYPKEAGPAWRVDSIIDALVDIMNAITNAFFIPDEAMKAEAMKTIF